MPFTAEIADEHIVLTVGQEQAVANAIVTVIAQMTGANLNGARVTLTFSRANEVTEIYSGQVEQ